ncbi:hypothetical protein JKF63_02960 [Porcisia hertigi]|uniref:PH domain-containing protein n=1 Tax=Porcisia hertigi TaxID=2761500 RepID=A0A836IND6_9TRYP|nr:hypothetical protein JKF63_02960 [Porcisia hertigi]
MSFSRGAPPKKKHKAKLCNSVEKNTEEQADPKRSASTRLHVSFAQETQTTSIPGDQENPSDVWNVYSHVKYTTKKEQRFLQRCRQSRIQETINRFSNLFQLAGNYPQRKETAQSGRSGGRIDGPLLATLKANGYSESIAACVMYVLSVWPSFPVRQRPPISPKVQRSLEALQTGTHLYVFNEKPNSPLLCGTALRLLHSIDGDEASVTIFSSKECTTIEGYIPLSFVVSLSFGLEPIERERHLKKNGKITCNDGNNKREETSKRAFTLHCVAPERFYVTFIAETQEDFDKWTIVIDYFVLLNSCRRTYMQSR